MPSIVSISGRGSGCVALRASELSPKPFDVAKHPRLGDVPVPASEEGGGVVAEASTGAGKPEQ
jgi:hypothetical protein